MAHVTKKAEAEQISTVVEYNNYTNRNVLRVLMLAVCHTNRQTVTFNMMEQTVDKSTAK